MPNKVGPKGQLVIDKAIRERLGVLPGWEAVQMIAGDHVKIYFVPPPHRRSLKGSLSQYVTRSVGDGEEWERAREAAWDEAARGEFGRQEEQQ